MQIDRLNAAVRDKVQPDSSVRGSAAAPKASFAEALKSTLADITADQQQADQVLAKGATEGAGDIHESMIRLEEADISMRLLLKVRGKALEAYQEIMRMQF